MKKQIFFLHFPKQGEQTLNPLGLKHFKLHKVEVFDAMFGF
jgi:hypothetical protein